MTRVVARAERVVEYSMPGVHDSRLEVEMFQIMDEAAGKDDAALVFFKPGGDKRKSYL